MAGKTLRHKKPEPGRPLANCSPSSSFLEAEVDEAIGRCLSLISVCAHLRNDAALAKASLSLLPYSAMCYRPHRLRIHQRDVFFRIVTSREAMPRAGQSFMISAPTNPASPIALQPGQGEALWFLGSLAIIKASARATGGRVAIIENLAPRGHGSPLHVHHREDEWFYVIEGDLTFCVGGRIIEAPAGSFVYGPRDIPHTFIVSSSQSRFLVVTEPAGFEEFVRALSEPAQTLALPPETVKMPPPERMMAAAAEYGIDIMGPPGIPP